MTRRLPAWGIVAVASGLLGIVASLMLLPAAPQAVLVAALVLCGPGAAVRNWVPVPPSMTAVVVPAIGLATVVLLSTAAAAAELWRPREMLLVLAAAVILAGLTRWPPARTSTAAHSRVGVNR